MKSILFLDANETIVPAILYAKEIGYKVITCDNIPTHIGHKYADVSYNISTYDIDNLLEIAIKEDVCGVVYFASAHGLYGGSILIEKLNLPGITNNIEQIFSNKGVFRHFLEKNSLNYPYYIITENNQMNLESSQYPVIVKPVDSSGGNIGVTKVESNDFLQNAISEAIKSSFSHKALIERFIESDLQINGDCLIDNGMIKFCFLGKHIFNSKESIVPFATVFGPDILENKVLDECKKQIQNTISLTGLKNGILNVELRIDQKDNRPYIIEINPRHSGNKIYKLMNIEYGVSFEQISVNNSIGREFHDKITQKNGYYAYCILYSRKNGILKRVNISSKLKDVTIEKFDFKLPNDEINEFKLLKDRVSLLLLSFHDKKEMENIVYNIEEYYQIELA